MDLTIEESGFDSWKREIFLSSPQRPDRMWGPSGAHIQWVPREFWSVTDIRGCAEMGLTDAAGIGAARKFAIKIIF
jgi:hypothetical protein